MNTISYRAYATLPNQFQAKSSTVSFGMEHSEKLLFIQELNTVLNRFREAALVADVDNCHVDKAKRAIQYGVNNTPPGTERKVWTLLAKNFDQFIAFKADGAPYFKTEKMLLKFPGAIADAEAKLIVPTEAEYQDPTQILLGLINYQPINDGRGENIFFAGISNAQP